MELESFDTATLEAGEGFVSKEFGVDPTIAMLVLRHKIYVRPREAMVREVLSNARDANRENGKADVPVEVTLDNSSPVFIVKDKGVGISPERLKFFTCYGGSTKRDDNSQTGGWGLGCKSPFSVSDQFTVHTVWKDKDGKKYQATYLMLINSQNRSAYNVLSKGVVDGRTPTGTEIHVPIPAEDLHQFRAYVEAVTRYWDHPAVANSVRPKYSWPVEKKEHVPLKDGQNFCDGKGLVLDGIIYDLSVSNFVKFPTNLKPVAERLRYFFNTGEIDVNPTREEVDYGSTKTFDAVYNSATTAKDAIKKEVLEILEPLRGSPLFASFKLATMSESQRLVSKEVMEEFCLPSIDTRLHASTFDTESFRIIVDIEKAQHPLHTYWRKKNLSVDMQSSKRDEIQLRDLLHGKVGIVVQDIYSSRPNTYIRGALASGFDVLVYIPTVPAKHRKTDKKDANGKVIEEVVEESNLDDVIEAVKKTEAFKELGWHLLSSFPKTAAPAHLVDSTKKERKRVSKDFLRDMHDKAAPTTRRVSSNRGGVYLISRYFKGYTFLNGNRYDKDTGKDLMPEAPELGTEYKATDLPHGVPVWGVLPKSFKELGKGWLTPTEYFEKASKRKVGQDIETVMTFDEMSNWIPVKRPDELRVFANRIGPGKLRDFFLKVLETPYVRLNNRLSIDSGVIQRIGSDEWGKMSTRAEKKAEKLLKNFPLLKGINQHCFSTDVLRTEVTYYIRSKRKA